MTYIAFKIPVFEYEAGWGNKIDDWMVCLSEKDIFQFKIEFNSKNIQEKTPNWYMVAEGSIEPVFLTEHQYNQLSKNKRMWLSALNQLKEETPIDSKQEITKTGSLNEAMQQAIESIEKVVDETPEEAAERLYPIVNPDNLTLKNSQTLLRNVFIRGIRWEQDRKKHEKE